MIYQPCSMDSVIGRVIRNTRVQDTAYIADMVEWIPEAMEMMETRMQTEGAIADVVMKFHKHRLPCGLLYIDAVEHMGRRLPRGNSVKSIRRPNTHEQRSGGIEQTWTSVPFKYPAPGDQSYLYFSTLQKVERLPQHDAHYYEIELGCILTDFDSGPITIYYRRTMIDDKGLPLIPDNSNYKEALYWYTRAKMIGAGFDDRIVKMEECDRKFEFYAGRAMGEITYPSPDEMEHRVNTFARLIPVENYFENYFRVDHGEHMFDPMQTGMNRLGETGEFYI